MTPTMTQIWRNAQRQHVIDCLSRDEWPSEEWDKKFPDLAARRRAEVAESEARETAERDMIGEDRIWDTGDNTELVDAMMRGEIEL